MAKSGIVLNWNKKFEVKGNDCLYPFIIHAGDVRKIQITHMLGSFVILGIGIVSAISSLFSEVFWKRSNTPNLKVAKPESERISVGKSWEKLKNFYSKINQGSLYTAYQMSKANKPVVGSDSSIAKLSFVYPNVKEVNQIDNGPLGNFGSIGSRKMNTMSAMNDGKRPKVFSNQVFNTNYSNQQSLFGRNQNMKFNTQANYDYYTYNLTRNNNNNNYY